MHQTSIRSQIIYCVTIIAVLIGFAALPFVYTTVSIKSSGSLQSNTEKIELFAPISGRIVKLNLKDNQKVVVGKILLSIDASSTIQQTSLLKNRINDLSQLLQDAGALTNFDFNSSSSPILQTGFYLASWQQYSEQNQNELNTL